MIAPTTRMINGEGKPRLVLVQNAVLYTSGAGTTYASDSVTEAEGTPTNIVSSSAATDFITANAHGLNIGDYVRIAGHDAVATPSINDKYRVIDKTVNTFKVNSNITVDGTGVGTVRKTPAFALQGIQVNRRVVINPGASTANPLRWAKITAVDDSANKLTIDSWVGGTPSATDVFQISGWIADLPYCYSLVERFEPDVTIHNLWRSRLSSKHYGWLYSATLDYAKFIVGDTIYLLKPHLAMEQNDQLVFIPRVDQPGFNYNVFFHAPIDMSMFGKGLGHQNMIFQLTGKEPIASFPMVAGYGMDYADGYGTQL